MMNDKKKILIVGNAYDYHLYRFMKHISINTNLINIDFYSYTKKDNQIPIILNLCKNIFYKSYFFPKLFYKIPVIRIFLSSLDLRFTFIKQISRYYDIINIHYVSIDNFLCANLYKKKSKVLILSPWGSDVLRSSSINNYLLKKLYKKADYISLSQTGFKDKVQSIFKLPNFKIINMEFGSDMIDVIEINQAIDKKEAKKILKFENKYIITIGYNGSKGQNHMKIIEQINLIKDSLPTNLYLVLPMTYPTDNQEYISMVKNKIEEYNISYSIYDSFLSNDTLLLIRKCTDIFIHAQVTDASSASLQEYLLVDCIVLNASWLKYPQFEKYGMPYFSFDNIEEIGEKLLYVIRNQKSIKVHESLKIDLYNNGWNKAIKPWINFYLDNSKN